MGDKITKGNTLPCSVKSDPSAFPEECMTGQVCGGKNSLSPHSSIEHLAHNCDWHLTAYIYMILTKGLPNEAE